MKKQLNFILAIGLLFIVTACENNREPIISLKDKYYFTDTEISSILTNKCLKCHDGVAPYGKKVNTLDYSKVIALWVDSTQGIEQTKLYLAVKQPGGAMIGPEFGGLTVIESQILIKWLETGAQK